MGQLRRELGESEGRAVAQLANEHQEVRVILSWVKWVLERQHPEAIEQIKKDLEQINERLDEVEERSGPGEQLKDHVEAQVKRLTARFDPLHDHLHELRERHNTHDSRHDNHADLHDEHRQRHETLESRVERLEAAVADVGERNTELANVLHAQAKALRELGESEAHEAEVAEEVRQGLELEREQRRNAEEIFKRSRVEMDDRFQAAVEITDALEAQVKTLISRVDTLDSKTMTAHIERFEGSVASLEARNEGFRVAITDALEAQVQAISTRMDMLGNVLDTMSPTVLDMVEVRNAAMKTELTDVIEAQVKAMNVRLDNMDFKGDSVSAEVRRLEGAAFMRLEGAVANLEAWNSGPCAELTEALQSQVKALSVRMDTLGNKVDMMRPALTRLQGSVAELEARNSGSGGNADLTTSLQAQVKALNQRIDEALNW